VSDQIRDKHDETAGTLRGSRKAQIRCPKCQSTNTHGVKGVSTASASLYCRCYKCEHI
jgi:hypothetical protein